MHHCWAPGFYELPAVIPLLYAGKTTKMKTNANPRIFVVDNDVTSLNRYLLYFQTLGYLNVVAFTDVHSCIENLAPGPAIVFLAHQGCTGTGVLQKIKQFNPDTYVVFISGVEDVQNTIRSLRYGAFDYIMKGCNLEGQIEKVLGRILELMKLLKGREVVLKTIFPSMVSYCETA